MHIARYCIVAMGLAIGSFLFSPAGVMAAELRPSFHCDGSLSPTERTICGNADLAAFDRTMAWVFARTRESRSMNLEEQRIWLKQRNSCGSNRNCLAQAYRDWFRGLDQIPHAGPRFERIGGQPGHFSFRKMGDDWLLFQADAAYLYDLAQGKGRDFSDSAAAGVARMSNGKAFWDSEPGYAGSCKIEITQLSQRIWKLVEIDRGCSGLGSTLSGTYRRR